MRHRRIGLLLAALALPWTVATLAQNAQTPSLLESRLQQIRQGQMNARTAASVLAAMAARSSSGIDPIEPDDQDRARGNGRGNFAKPNKGGFIPAAIPAPKTDDFGSQLGYCVSGKKGAKKDARFNALAVIFAGPDRDFQTNCDDALQGNRSGDDYVTTFSATTISAASSATAVASVPTRAARTGAATLSLQQPARRLSTLHRSRRRRTLRAARRRRDFGIGHRPR